MTLLAAPDARTAASPGASAAPPVPASSGRAPADLRTLTDRALAAHADRIVHAAAACTRPWLRDDAVAVAWQGDRGLFPNPAVVLREPDGADGWRRLVERIAEVVPHGRPVSLVPAAGVPDLSALGWVSIGRPPFMVRPAGGSPR